MEACPQMKFKLVVQRKEGHIFSYHVPKRPKAQNKIDFWYSKVQVSKRTWMENFNFCWLFWDKQVCGSPPPKNVQVFLQILNPVNNAEILPPELLGGQSEMMV